MRPSWILIAVLATIAVAFSEDELFEKLLEMPFGETPLVSVHEIVGPNQTVKRAEYQRIRAMQMYPKTEWNQERDHIAFAVLMDAETGELPRFPDRRRWLRMGSCGWNSNTQTYGKNYNLGGVDFNAVFFEEAPEPETGDIIPTREQFQEMQRTDVFPPDDPRAIELAEQICWDYHK